MLVTSAFLSLVSFTFTFVFYLLLVLYRGLNYDDDDDDYDDDDDDGYTVSTLLLTSSASKTKLIDSVLCHATMAFPISFRRLLGDYRGPSRTK